LFFCDLRWHKALNEYEFALPPPVFLPGDSVIYQYLTGDKYDAVVLEVMGEHYYKIEYIRYLGYSSFSKTTTVGGEKLSKKD
jgi:hypothetical protein